MVVAHSPRPPPWLRNYGFALKMLLIYAYTFRLRGVLPRILAVWGSRLPPYRPRPCKWGQSWTLTFTPRPQVMFNVLYDYIIPSNSIHLYTKMNAYMYIWTNINDILIILMHIYIKYIFDIYIYILH